MRTGFRLKDREMSGLAHQPCQSHLHLSPHRQRAGHAAGVLPDGGWICPQTTQTDGGKTGDRETDPTTARYQGETGHCDVQRDADGRLNVWR